MERGQRRTPNVSAHVYKRLVGGVTAIATPTKKNHNGEQNASIVKVYKGFSAGRVLKKFNITFCKFSLVFIFAYIGI